jgi:hypothetical protein
MHCSLLNYNPFLPVGRKFLGKKTSFLEPQVAVCCFSKEFRANLRSESSNKKKGTALAIFESVLQIQKLWCQAAITFEFNL